MNVQGDSRGQDFSNGSKPGTSRDSSMGGQGMKKGTMKDDLSGSTSGSASRGTSSSSSLGMGADQGDSRGEWGASGNSISNTLMDTFDQITSELRKNTGEVGRLAEKYSTVAINYAKKNPLYFAIGAGVLAGVAGVFMNGRKRLAQ